MFEEKYFVQSKTSNYQDYRKRKFDLLASDLIKILKLKPSTNILDFGCATGGLILSFKNKGLKKIKGTDISYWAIDYGKKHFKLENELEYCNINLLNKPFDIIFFLDVLEHIPSIEEIKKLLGLIKEGTIIVVRVPVSKTEGEPYVLEVSRNDATHVQCHTKNWWCYILGKCGFVYRSIIVGRSIYDSEGVFVAIFKKEDKQ